MALNYPTPRGTERSEYAQPGFYLPSMPSGRLVGVVRRLVTGLDRYDLAGRRG